jgi:chromosomal replication initiator protein
MNYWIVPAIKKTVVLPITRTEHTNFIIDAVIRHFNITMAQMAHKTRKKDVVRARQTAMFLLVKHTGLTKSKIGLIFGRDHTTVIHSCQSISTHISCEQETADEIAHIENMFQ